jgi:hypothetical protein
VRKLPVLAAVFVLGFAAPAAGQAPAAPVVAAPQFVSSFPALVPVDSTPAAHSRAEPSGALGLDGLALAAAIYWLLLGALAVRQVRLRTPHEDPVPIAGWVLACAPPVPR